MASSTPLEQQLQSIAAAAGLRQPKSTVFDPVAKRKGRASLLYTFEEAADIGLDELYESGLKGFDQLCRIDPRFTQCRKALFSSGSRHVDMNEHDEAGRIALDKTVDIFCKLLGPYVLLPAAMHSLEYLIRKFEIHERNVSSLMKAFLPYHQTPEFSRCVMIARVQNTVFEFLSPMKKSPTQLLTREKLVQRCLTDRALLRFVCDMALEVSDPTSIGVPSCMGWYAVLICEYLNTPEATVDEDCVAFFLPYIAHGIKGHVLPEYRDATYMIVGQLARRAVFSEDMLYGMLCDITSTCTPGSVPQVLLLLSHLAISQHCFVSVPEKAFDYLSRLPNSISELGRLTKKIPLSRKFAFLFFKASAQRAIKTDVQIYCEMVKSVQFGDLACDASFTLLAMAMQTLEGDEQDRLVQMLKQFDLYHSNATENTINDFLSETDKDSPERTNVLSIVGKSLEDTVRAPLKDANVTLASGIDHSSASVRITALEKLNELCSAGNSLKDEAEIILKSAFVRRVEDDDLGVVAAVLNLSQLSHLIPEKILMEHLIKCLDRSINLIYTNTTSKKTRSLARKVAKAALILVPVVSKDENLIIGTLLSVLFTATSSYKVSLEALRILTEYKSSLQNCFAELRNRYLESQTIKRTRKSDQASDHDNLFDAEKFNNEVLDTLSNFVLNDTDVSRSLLSILTNEPSMPYAFSPVLCVLEKVVGTNPEKTDKNRDEIAKEVIKWFYNSHSWTINQQRLSNTKCKSLWDFKKKNLTAQAIHDVATRSTDFCSIEPEVILLSLQRLSTGRIIDLVQPTLVELYAFFASLPSSVWRKHMDVLVQNMEDPVANLSKIWINCSIEAKATISMAALDQWVGFVSTQKLSERQRQEVVNTIVPVLFVMSSSSEMIRHSGLNCCLQLKDTIKSWWPAKAKVSKDIILSLLEVCVKSKERILRDADGVEYLLQQLIEGNFAPTKKKTKSPRASEARPLFLDSQGLSSFMLMELGDSSSIDRVCLIPLLLKILEVSNDGDKVSSICSDLLDKLFYDIEREEFVSSLDSLQSTAALEILNSLNDSAIYNSKCQNPEKVLRATILAAQWNLHPELREIALKALVNSVDVSGPGDVVPVLMAAASSEADHKCRDAALETLDRIKIPPKVLLPFLRLSAPKRGQKKRTKSPTHKDADLHLSNSFCLQTLELLQWKKDIDDKHQFVEPIQDLIKEFMTVLQDGKSSFSDDMIGQGPAVLGYGLQLSLSVLLDISENDIQGMSKDLFDTGVIVDCASSASDHAVRTAALELLRSRIDLNPNEAMNYVVKTVETICTVVISDQDKYSTSLAARVMSTAAAAWMSGGNSIHELVSNVINAVKDSSASKKYAILAAIVDSMPENASEISASIAYHLLLSFDSTEMDTWKQDAAFSMISKRKKPTCIAALGFMLQLCMSSEENRYEILLRANKIAQKILIMYCKSFQRLQEEDEKMFDSYEMIMQSVLHQLQVIGKSRAKSSDPFLLDIENSAYNVLESLKDTMKHVHFINSLMRSLSHKDTTEQMKRKSMILINYVLTEGIADEDSNDPAFHQCVHDAVGTLVLLIKDNKEQEICRQIALEALSSFAKRFGAQYHDVFLQAIPTTMDLVADKDLPGIRGMALVCIASFIQSMENAIIPMIPKIILCVIAGSKAALQRKSSMPEHGTELDLSASLTTLQALSETFASFLSPNMIDILRILLHNDVVNSDDSKVRSIGQSCRDTIATSVPARLLAGPLSDILNEIFSLQREETNEWSTLMTLKMLATMITGMDSTEVATYSLGVFSMILRGLDTRRTMSYMSAKETYEIESASIWCMQELVLKLNESKFKPIFFRLIEWATTSPPGEANASIARKIAFFNVIIALTEKLKSVFTSYFNPLLNLITETLTEAVNGESNSGKESATLLVLQLTSMRALTRCFMHDTSGFLNEATFDKLLDPLVHILMHQSSLSKTILEDESRLIEEYGVATDAVIHSILHESPEWIKETLGIFTCTTIACISQMTTASGMGTNGEVRWRPLHHAVLMATRGSSADSRCAALEIISFICNTLQEEYLPLLPEALPFLSELLEDEDSRVEKRTVEVLKMMEIVSGEDLKQYLTSAQ